MPPRTTGRVRDPRRAGGTAELTPTAAAGVTPADHPAWVPPAGAPRAGVASGRPTGRRQGSGPHGRALPGVPVLRERGGEAPAAAAAAAAVRGGHLGAGTAAGDGAAELDAAAFPVPPGAVAAAAAAAPAAQEAGLGSRQTLPRRRGAGDAARLLPAAGAGALSHGARGRRMPLCRRPGRRGTHARRGQGLRRHREAAGSPGCCGGVRRPEAGGVAGWGSCWGIKLDARPGEAGRAPGLRGR